MTLINYRWPRDLCPETCVFGASRNDVIQRNPNTRKTKVYARGRRLWSAKCSWTLPNDESLAKLRYILDSLDGYAGSVQLWDFTSPYPQGLTLATPGDIEPVRIWWTYNNVRAPWTFAGLPTHWTLGNTVSLSTSLSAGATFIELTGLAPSTIAVVQGQYVQVGRRLYLAKVGATSNAGGVAVVELTSGLISAATAGDPVRLVEAGCEMQRDEQNYEISMTAGNGFASVSASFVETVEDFT